MSRNGRSIERESECRVFSRGLEERVIQVVPVQDVHVIVDHVSDIHEHLVKAQTLHLAIPGVRLNELVKLFARVPEATDVFAKLDDDIWTYPPGVANKL